MSEEQDAIASYHSLLLTSPDLSFPWRLFIMLESSKKSSFDNIVSWTVNGTAFTVHDQEKFVATILPRYFKMTKYNSFTRQLYAYGFSWIRSGEGKGGYRHPRFTQDTPNNCSEIKRRNKKQEGGMKQTPFPAEAAGEDDDNLASQPVDSFTLPASRYEDGTISSSTGTSNADDTPTRRALTTEYHSSVTSVTTNISNSTAEGALPASWYHRNKEGGVDFTEYYYRKMKDAGHHDDIIPPALLPGGGRIDDGKARPDTTHRTAGRANQVRPPHAETTNNIKSQYLLGQGSALSDMGSFEYGQNRTTEANVQPRPQNTTPSYPINQDSSSGALLWSPTNNFFDFPLDDMLEPRPIEEMIHRQDDDSDSEKNRPAGAL